MAKKARILVETTEARKKALASVLEENGATLTEWLTDNIVQATAELASIAEHTPPDLLVLEDLASDAKLMRMLNAVDWSFEEDDTSYLSHDIHPYPAKFIPQIPRNLIARLSTRGETVWDPFGGSGTTALEAVLLGRQAISSDVNPLAEVIGQGKQLTLTKEDDDYVASLIEELSVVASSEDSVAQALARHEQLAADVPDIPNGSNWFDSQAVAELSYIRSRIESIPSERCKRLARVCFSKIILRSSLQDSETRYTRCEREFPAGKVLRLFTGALESSAKKIRYLSALLNFREARFVTADLRLSSVVPSNSIDLVVTSPPYPNTTDYHLYHRFRLFWLGHDPRELGNVEIGSHLRHQKEGNGIEQYLHEMQLCLGNVVEALRPGRIAVFVIGDAVFKGEVFDTTGLVADRAKHVGFQVVGRIERDLPVHRRSFVPKARRLRTESLLILRKPKCSLDVQIHPPSYKLWPYEARIRRKEIEHLSGQQVSGDIRGTLTTRIQSLHVDRLRRLTFSHMFSGQAYHEEPTWQAILENGDAIESSSRKDPKYVTHGIHDYKGKFYPQLARSMFNLAELKPGSLVLDPFCGSGTVLLEAYLNGMAAKGFDMNPLAVRVARAKSGILLVDPYVRDRLLARFQERARRLSPLQDDAVFPEGVLGELESWFPDKVRHKLASLIVAIREEPEPRVKALLEVLLSSIVRQVSQQDPEDLRIRRRRTPIDDAPVYDLFGERLAEQRRRLAEFASRSNRAPVAFGNVSVFEGDNRHASTYSKANVEAATVDAVVTSPPYATALPYIDTDRLSILLLDGRTSSERSDIERRLTGSREIRKSARAELEAEIMGDQLDCLLSATAKRVVSDVYRLNKNADVGFRRKNMSALLFRYYADMANAFRQLDRVLKPGGSAFIVIGDTKTTAGSKEVIIKSADAVTEISTNLGWNLVERIPITVTQEKRPHNKNSITDNDVIWLRKPIPAKS